MEMKTEKKVGDFEYVNKNCWLARTLDYSPSERCRYCELKFYQCLFFQYTAISFLLVFFLLGLSFLIEGEVLKLVAVSVLAPVIIYGHFFSTSTEKIIKANFIQTKAKEALEELSETLKEKVEEQTKEIKKAYGKMEKAYEAEKRVSEELKRLTYDLTKANAELKNLDKAKSEFLSIVSHQFRTPLSIIKGYISMIIDGSYGELSGEIKQPLKNIYLSNERLIELVDNILNLSRIEAGRVKINLEHCSPEDVVSAAVKEMAIKAKEKGLKIKWEKPKKPLPKVLLDRNMFRQIILNLLDNGIKYTERGLIAVSAGNKEGKIVFEIKDTGEGMTEAEVSRLFTSFSRGDAGSKFWANGTGLGLYVAKKFVEMHGGRVWAKSAGKKKGSTFYVELPVSQNIGRILYGKSINQGHQ